MKSIAAMTSVFLLCSGAYVSAQGVARFDVLITEIFADPSPPKGMPSHEFIEIMNVSSVPYNLKDWKIGDGSSAGTISTNVILEPGRIAILCSNSATLAF